MWTSFTGTPATPNQLSACPSTHWPTYNTKTEFSPLCPPSSRNYSQALKCADYTPLDPTTTIFGFTLQPPIKTGTQCLKHDESDLRLAPERSITATGIAPSSAKKMALHILNCEWGGSQTGQSHE